MEEGERKKVEVWMEEGEREEGRGWSWTPTLRLQVLNASAITNGRVSKTSLTTTSRSVLDRNSFIKRDFRNQPPPPLHNIRPKEREKRKGSSLSSTSDSCNKAHGSHMAVMRHKNNITFNFLQYSITNTSAVVIRAGLFCSFTKSI